MFRDANIAWNEKRMNHGFQLLLQKFQPGVMHFTGMEKKTHAPCILCLLFIARVFTFGLIEGSLSPKNTLQK